eukprot:3292324-Ditylum_brightwellii.AAC.1
MAMAFAYFDIVEGCVCLDKSFIGKCQCSLCKYGSEELIGTIRAATAIILLLRDFHLHKPLIVSGGDDYKIKVLDTSTSKQFSFFQTLHIFLNLECIR